MADLEQVIEQLRAYGTLELHPLRVRDDSLSQQVVQGGAESLFGSNIIVDRSAAKAVQSGLLLWNDDLDASHTIAQKIETEDGSLWHAMMHRREGDHSNSKYWFHNAGEHPIFPKLYDAALAACEAACSGQALYDSWERMGRWNPSFFVDMCAAVQSGDETHRALLEQIQLHELELLLAYCIQKAIGSTAAG